MTTARTLDDLRSRILAGYQLLFLRTYEEERWQSAIGELAEEMSYDFITWSATHGPEPAIGEVSGPCGPVEFITQLDEQSPRSIVLLKDFHPYADDPAVVRFLRDQLPALRARQQTLLFLGPVAEVPIELEKESTIVELPLPGMEEMRDELAVALSSIDGNGATIAPDDVQQERMIKSVLGLTALEARKAFQRALQGREQIDDDVFALLVSEKRHMVQGSDLLEFFDLDEGVDDIGGLEGLKDWVLQRADAFNTDAQQVGISNPKGVLLLGVQGCGKSLSARAIAKTLRFPLVRLDMSALLEQGRGSSEQNLREVLNVMELIAPSVLWLEEIDKAFAGFDDEASGDATMSRIVGRFLTWMQEHEAPVFVVATANNVSHLPPDMLRRGRFDELFFVDLPNYHERKHIFDIHLARRQWKPDKFDVEALASSTEGYSGAEIEQIVNAAIIESYSQKRMLSQEDLANEKEHLVPLSVTMEDAIFDLREWARPRCRPATPDSRIVQVMEDEVRRGEQNVEDGSGGPAKARWIELAEFGQFGAALVEHVRYLDVSTFARIQHDFAEFEETAGECGLVLRSDPKVVLWTRISEEFADTLIKYLEGKRLYLHPGASDLYQEPPEGIRLPKLPILDALPDEKVDRAHWLPCSLRTLPPPEGSSRFGRIARIRMAKK